MLCRRRPPAPATVAARAAGARRSPSIVGSASLQCAHHACARVYPGDGWSRSFDGSLVIGAGTPPAAPRATRLAAVARTEQLQPQAAAAGAPPRRRRLPVRPGPLAEPSSQDSAYQPRLQTCCAAEKFQRFPATGGIKDRGAKRMWTCVHTSSPCGGGGCYSAVVDKHGPGCLAHTATVYIHQIDTSCSKSLSSGRMLQQRCRRQRPAPM